MAKENSNDAASGAATAPDILLTSAVVVVVVYAAFTLICYFFIGDFYASLKWGLFLSVLTALWTVAKRPLPL